jgi:hypothetical protein
MADSAKQANEECQRTASSMTTSLAAKEEGARALALRADAAEAARAQAEADAAAARARLESEVADLRARAAAAEARAAEAHGRLESERQRRQGLEAGARQSNLLRHLPRAEGASDRGAAQHGELAPLLKQVGRCTCNSLRASELVLQSRWMGGWMAGCMATGTWYRRTRRCT